MQKQKWETMEEGQASFRQIMNEQKEVQKREIEQNVVNIIRKKEKMIKETVEKTSTW